MAKLQRGRHAIAAEPEVSDIRVLARGDLAVLTIPRPGKSLQNLRDNHHRIARAMASGLSNADVAQLCGVSVNRVSMYRSDPAMRELIAHKRAMIDAEFAAAGDPVIDFLKSNALKAAAMLSDKLDAAAEAEEFLPTRDLLGIAELGFDRTGYGKVQKNFNVNIDLAANLERARRAQDKAREMRTIEARPTPHPEPQSAPAGSPIAPRRSVPPPPLRRL